MDRIKRRIGGKWGFFPVYTEAEALERGLKPVPWREANPGDWALSDDGYVGECLRVFESEIASSRHVTLTYGADWDKSIKPLLYEERAATFNWSGSSKSDWARRDSRKTRAKIAIAAYVVMRQAGQQIDWKTLGQIYRPDQRIPEARVRRDFKKAAFQEMIQRELERVLVESESTPNRTIEMYNEAFSTAKTKGQPSVMVDVADRFSELWRLKESLISDGELPPGLGDATILEGVESDLEIAKESSNGK